MRLADTLNHRNGTGVYTQKDYLQIPQKDIAQFLSKGLGDFYEMGTKVEKNSLQE